MPDELPEFDVAVFKLLSKNDTGQSAGHQGGMVIPREFDRYFPKLPPTSTKTPTVDRSVRAILVVPGTGEKVVQARYQKQSWGGGKSTERRLTRNLGFLRNRAKSGDYLVIERGFADRNLFRLTLITKGTRAFRELSVHVAGNRWGVLNNSEHPVPDSEIEAAEKLQRQHEKKPLKLFDNEAALTESRVKKYARGKAFQKRVIMIYGNKCALCGAGLAHPLKGSELEAAHIVPRASRGADDARNGLALCRAHHWAFDRGLFGVSAAGEIQVPKKISGLNENAPLIPFRGKKLRLPVDASLIPSAAALKWHLENIVRI